MQKSIPCPEKFGQGMDFVFVSRRLQIFKSANLQICYRASFSTMTPSLLKMEFLFTHPLTLDKG